MSPETLRARRIARVLRLTEQGESARVIAKKIGVSEATVRRWRRTPRATDDAPECDTAASSCTADDAPECVTDASPGASPPAHLTVPLDADLRAHLDVLAEAGHDPLDAVTRAVELLADAYRRAWDYGLYPRPQRPDIWVHVKGDMPPPGRPGSRPPDTR